MPISLGTLTIAAMYLGTTAISSGYLGTTQVFGGSAFSPSSLFAASEPGVWYDPSDLTTLFQDTAGTVAVTTPGQTVARINDKSGRGNNATQATAASRPTYGVVPLGGRRNLLTWSEDYRNTAAAGEARPWTYPNTAITPNADGVSELVYPLTSGTTRGIERTIGGVSSAAYATSIEAKASGFTWLYLYGGQGNSLAYFNLSTGAVGTVGSGLTAAISGPDAGGYYRCSVTQTCTSLSFYAGGCDANGSTQATASGTNGVLLRNAQLELGSTATAYQKVTTAFDVTEAGVQSLSYLSFDGVDDFMLTGTITPGVDKVQVFAGVRKLSDAAYNSIVETSADPAANNGTIAVGASALLGGDRQTWVYQARGTANNFGGARVFAAPSTAVQTLLVDISQSTKETEIIGRLDGVQQSLTFSTSAIIGTGNFLAYPLYLGRRGGTTTPLNGNLYSLLVRFGANLTTDQITDTETWVNTKTGAF